jgi:3-oxoacyl-[acyl-carrier-protein] synthase II
LVIAPIDGFDLRALVGSFKEKRYLHRGAQLAVAAALRAARDSGLDSHSLRSASLFVASAPNLDFGGEFPTITNGHFDRIDLSPLFLLRFLPNTAAAAIARLLAITGENLSIGNACAASTQAIGEAFRRIRHGYAPVALAVGGDSRLNSGALLAYKKANALHIGSDCPTRAIRPFDNDRDGFVPGEGGAALVLEDLDHAIARNARIFAEVLGYGSSLDAGSLTDPDGDGRGALLAVNRALSEARLSPSQLELILAHGTGTLKNDRREAMLLHSLYPHSSPAILALKSWIGHLASACGVVELAIVLSCLPHNLLPKVRNLSSPCVDSLGFVRDNHTLGCPNYTLLESFGFGGQNAALALNLNPWELRQ